VPGRVTLLGRLLWPIVGLLVAFDRAAAQATHDGWNPATAAWTPAGPTMESSVILGDPSKPGAYSVAFRLKPGAWIPPHTHPRPKQVTVLSGVLRMGLGSALDSTATRPMGPGQVMVVPPETAHFEGASVATVVLFSGEGPLVTTWVKKDGQRP
jgi:quercetin dioxygenase-like cupin family protein